MLLRDAQTRTMNSKNAARGAGEFQLYSTPIRVYATVYVLHG